MMKKTAFFACVLMVILLAIQFVPVFAQQISYSQVWGERYRVGGYWGIDTIQTTPNPFIIPPDSTNGPNGVTNTVDTFIESGYVKPCFKDCGLHPYGSWDNKYGAGRQHIDVTVWLGAGLRYRYRVNYIGNNKWQSVFCSGTGCRGMITGNLGVNKLPYVVSGGESVGAFSGPHWGEITTSFAKYKPYNSTTWYSWCYTSTWISVAGGTVSACNTRNHSWTSEY